MSFGSFLRHIGHDLVKGMEGAAMGFLTGGPAGAAMGAAGGVAMNELSNLSGGSNSSQDFQASMVQMEESMMMQTMEMESKVTSW